MGEGEVEAGVEEASQVGAVEAEVGVGEEVGDRLALQQQLDGRQYLVALVEVGDLPVGEAQGLLHLLHVEGMFEAKQIPGLRALLQHEHHQVPLLAPGHGHGFFGGEEVAATE